MKTIIPLGFAVSFLLCSIGAAHPSTLPAHEASLDPHEALTPDLRQPAPDPHLAGASCALSLRLIDSVTGRPVPGLVRITRSNGVVVPLPGLVNRGVKLRASDPAKGWFVLTQASVIPLPREKLRLEAFAGLETELAATALDLTARKSLALALTLHRFQSPAAAGWHNGNTHLHLHNLTRAQADEYLRVVPRGDGLEMVFVSYTARIDADRDYISNEYTGDSLAAMSSPGLIFGNGEEHRHELTAPQNTGYGHVMLLQIKRLTQPVSIGSTIMGTGPDYPPLRRGIDQARADGATIIWCHGPWGHEQVPDWLTGRVDALNIFDNGRSNSYADTFYKFLNIGLKVPFSTGTDWFIYDFSRVYVRVDQPLTVSRWLKALESGRTFITNGPLLELRAGSAEIGDTVPLAGPAPVPVRGRAYGRGDFRRIELVWNGKIVAQALSHPVDGHFEADVDFRLAVDRSGWLALRVGNGSLDTGGSMVFPPEMTPPGPRDTLNEMDEALFAHTSPIYFEVAHRPIFERAAAEGLIREMETSIRAIQAKAVFDNAAQRREVLKIYQDGIELLQRRLRTTPNG